MISWPRNVICLIRGVYLPQNFGKELWQCVAKGMAKQIAGYLEEKCKAITENSKFRGIMKQFGQPVMFMPGPVYLAWLKKVYNQYGQLIKTRGIEVK